MAAIPAFFRKNSSPFMGSTINYGECRLNYKKTRGKENKERLEDRVMVVMTIN